MTIVRYVASILAATALAGWGVVAAAADEPALRSSAALVIDADTGEVLHAKNADAIVPIASITKLMTAMVTLDAILALEELITITADDAQAAKSKRRARVPVGATLTRGELLQLALMSSENVAAAALGRTYPGGMGAFVAAMNAKAHDLDMTGSRFVEPTGLSSENVSTAEDLVKLVRAAGEYTRIADYSTMPSAEYSIRGRRVAFANTNGLVRGNSWEIGVSKTGFINAAGRCLVMEAKVATRSLIIVLLDSVGKYTRIGDANRIRQWLEPGFLAPAEPRSVTARPKATVKAQAQRAPEARVRKQVRTPAPGG
jgi:D-alanyl-D-alanine endopeptidase (penicillin-binding protein 7)